MSIDLYLGDRKINGKDLLSLFHQENFSSLKNKNHKVWLRRLHRFYSLHGYLSEKQRLIFESICEELIEEMKDSGASK
jgi:hypothetical protein